MIYELRHRTTYDYEDPVTFARCVLRLTPQSSGRQTVLRSAVTVTPAPSDTLHRSGAFGEHTITVVLDKPHRSLVIEGRSKVDVHAPAITPQLPSAPWEDIRTVSYRSPDLGADSPAAFLYPTRRTRPIGMITDYARRSFTPGRQIIQAAADLMTRIKVDFTYDPDATEVSTPTAEAFEARHGVCQDFAHVMISGLRGLGLPVAYVSGYLRTNPPPGRPRLAGADATHAWVQVWCGDTLGWVGFDPTNAILALDDHIVLAVGRDYSDVAPIDGVILAPGVQKLNVEVDVIPEGEVAPRAQPARAS